MTTDNGTVLPSPSPTASPAGAAAMDAASRRAMPPPVSEERRMNDTTMPPPPMQRGRSKNRAHPVPAADPVRSPAARRTAVNVRERGVRRGFGLHDWKRLLRSSHDLAQRQGQPLRRDITVQEVRQHNKEYDGWMILRGRVYNIGPYLHYHPGGVRILKALLGKDGTALFDKYHRWVNIDGLIGPLCLGTLAKSLDSNLARDRQTPTAQAVPTGTANLPSAPRVSTKPASAQSSALGGNDSDSEEEEEDDDLLLSPPLPPQSS